MSRVLIIIFIVTFVIQPYRAYAQTENIDSDGDELWDRYEWAEVGTKIVVIE
ncbi:MAG: hypothetical protein HY564_01985 [Candidatus Jacksonbacteria bacterium]|nr:hypothetical protein [Candidatus Jacksonbacteria bacterium]